MVSIVLACLSLLCFVLASICNSIMDKVTHHFHTSIFNDIGLDNNNVWWNGETSWKNKYIDGDSTKGRVKIKVFGREFNKPVQLTDAWHFFKALMIIFIVASIVLFNNLGFDWWYNVLCFFIYGITWNMTFTFFYHNIFEKYKHK